MTAAVAMPGNTAEPFLVHFLGTGPANDRYVAERYRARADGDIVPARAEALAAKGRRKVKRSTATLKAANSPLAALDDRHNAIHQLGYPSTGFAPISCRQLPKESRIGGAGGAFPGSLRCPGVPG